MSYRNSVNLVASAAIALFLTACGTTPAAVPYGLHATTARGASHVVAQGVPPASTFQTVQATVTQLLPDNHNPNNNLDHQNFVVKTTTGQVLYVNNDITAGIGTKVPLTVGEAVTIRGVEYVDPGKSGIHWTHHASVPNDAGFIKTPDGHVYQ